MDPHPPTPAAEPPAAEPFGAPLLDDGALVAALTAADAPRSPARVAVTSIAAACAVVALGYLSAVHGGFVPFLSGVDLGIHEFGHLITSWAPQPLCAFAGSGLQVMAPLGLTAYFLFARRDFVGGSLCAAWAGTAARNVAVYVADAPFQRLQLFGGEGAKHDWAYLLGASAQRVAGPLSGAVNAVGWLLIAFGLVLALAPLLFPALGANRHA